MAKIPLMNDSRPVQQISTQDTSGQVRSAMTNAGRAYAQQGEILTEFANATQGAFEESEYQKAISLAERSTTDFMANRSSQSYDDEGNPTFGSMMGDTKQAMSDIHADSSSNLLSPNSQRRFNQSFERLTTKAYVEAGGVARKQMLSHTKGLHASSMMDIQNAAIEDGTVDGLYAGQRAIASSVTAQVKNGILSPEEGVLSIAKAKNTMGVQFLANAVHNNPEGALTMLNGSQASELGVKPTQRISLINNAEREIQSRKVAVEGNTKATLHQERINTVISDLSNNRQSDGSKKELAEAYDTLVSGLEDEGMDTLEAMTMAGTMFVKKSSRVINTLNHGATQANDDATLSGTYNMWKTLSNTKNAVVVTGLSEKALAVFTEADINISAGHASPQDAMRSARERMSNLTPDLEKANLDAYNTQKMEWIGDHNTVSFVNSHGALVREALGMGDGGSQHDHRFGREVAAVFKYYGNEEQATAHIANKYKHRVTETAAGDRFTIDSIESVTGVSPETVRAMMDTKLKASLPEGYDSDHYALEAGVAGANGLYRYDLVAKGVDATGWIFDDGGIHDEEQPTDSAVFGSDGKQLYLEVNPEAMKLSEQMKRDADRAFAVHEAHDSVAKSKLERARVNVRGDDTDNTYQGNNLGRMMSGNTKDKVDPFGVSEMLEARGLERERARSEAMARSEQVYRYEANGDLVVNRELIDRETKSQQRESTRLSAANLSVEVRGNIMGATDPIKVADEIIGGSLEKAYGSASLGLMDIVRSGGDMSQRDSFKSSTASIASYSEFKGNIIKGLSEQSTSVADFAQNARDIRNLNKDEVMSNLPLQVQQAWMDGKGGAMLEHGLTIRTAADRLVEGSGLSQTLNNELEASIKDADDAMFGYIIAKSDVTYSQDMVSSMRAVATEANNEVQGKVMEAGRYLNGVTDSEVIAKGLSESSVSNYTKVWLDGKHTELSTGEFKGIYNQIPLTTKQSVNSIATNHANPEDVYNGIWRTIFNESPESVGLVVAKYSKEAGFDKAQTKAYKEAFTNVMER